MSGTNEQMTTNESTGAMKGVKDERFDLLPVRPLQAIARHYGIGARKYADRNWEKGYEWSKSYQALQRHLNSFWGGEDIDEETGSPHLAAAAFHVLALLEFGETHPELDDRVFRDPEVEIADPPRAWVTKFESPPADLAPFQEALRRMTDDLVDFTPPHSEDLSFDELLADAIDLVVKALLDGDGIADAEKGLRDLLPAHWDAYSRNRTASLRRILKTLRRHYHELAEEERAQPGARVSVREILRALDENPVPINRSHRGRRIGILDEDGAFYDGLRIAGFSVNTVVALLDSLEAAGLQVTRA